MAEKEDIYKLMKLKMLQSMMQKPKNYLLIAVGLILLCIAVYAYMYPQQASDFVCKLLPFICQAEGICDHYDETAGEWIKVPVGYKKCVGTTSWECFADASWHPVGVC